MANKRELVVNFSGGKDSTAMLHLMLEHGEKIDEVIYFDGGWEFPQMAEHVELVEQKTGLKITRLKPELGSFDYYATEHIHKSRAGATIKGYGFPGSKSRWCTRLKMQAMQKHLKGRDVTQCIGFAVGEERRLLRGLGSVYKPGLFRFPLIEDYNYDEKECLQYCYNLGYTWGGLYNYFDRVSCLYCPLQGVGDCLILKRHYPELWAAIKSKSDYIKAQCSGDRTPPKWRNNSGFEATDARLRGKQEGWDVNEWRARLNMINDSND